MPSDATGPSGNSAAAPQQPLTTEPDRGPWHLRRVGMILVAAVLLGWLAVTGWMLLSARSDLLDARRELRAIRNEALGADLLDTEYSERLRDVRTRLERADERLDSPFVAPLRLVPFVERQLDSADALTDASRSVVVTSATTIDRMREVVDDADDVEADRVELLAKLEAAAADAGRSLRDVDLGPSTQLLGPLREARDELTEDLGELVELTGEVETAARGIGALLASDRCYLLFAANNAEMRAGSGMFLQGGELCFDGAEFGLRDMRSTGELRLPDDAVDIEDPDLAARWGELLPNAEFRNLALTPRFDVTAPLAARMWEQAVGRPVAGVLAVDPVALEVLLDSTGSIEVDGITYRSDDVVDQLLVEQYEDFLEQEIDQSERHERLGEVAREAVAALDSGGLDLDTLVDGLPEAVAGRHILGWSKDPAIQEAFVSMGMAGRMQADSLGVSILNRGGGTGGGKLDPFLEVETNLDPGTVDEGIRSVALDVHIENTVPEGEPTYVETVSEDTRFGVYEGFLAITLPGGSGRARIEVDGRLLPLVTAGADGPTRVVAAAFELSADQDLTFRVLFDLPGDLHSVEIEPSARVPATTWETPEGTNNDETGFVVDLYGDGESRGG